MKGILFDWFTNWVAKSPEELSVCEFDCRETECKLGDWEVCEQRLRSMPQSVEDNDS